MPGLTIAGATLGGAALAGGAALLGTGINYGLTKRARKENYEYNELAAENADLRAREFYNDLQSPKAQLEQLKAAGLSPSLFYGQGGGTSGYAGAQGAGASGQAAAQFTMPIDPLSVAQIANIKADTELKKADAGLKTNEAMLKETENKIKTIDYNLHNVDFQLVTSFVKNQDGTNTSFYDLAGNCDSIEQFITLAKKLANETNNKDLAVMIDTEQGQKTMRGIYLAQREFGKDLAVLAQQEIDANLANKIATALANEDFADLNARAQIKYLRNNIETADLDTAQKAAWNNLLKSLGEKSETGRDIAIILGLIVNQALSNYNYRVSWSHKAGAKD